MTRPTPTPPVPLYVGIVEDDDNIRAGVCRVIGAEPGWTVRFACDSLEKARAAPLQSIDVLLLDIGLPDGSGLELLNLIAPDVPALVISAIGDEATVVHAIECGAAGYLLKDAHPKDLVEAIRAVLEGGAPISPGVAGYLLRRMRGQTVVQRAQERTALEQLTPRETEVLRALTRGYSYEETGQLLGIARNTVGQHIKQIYAKLAVNSRSEAVFQAIQAGWLSTRGN
ncbi:MAG: response regulator transcription factor [Lysobacterales bacterium]